ncbi:MAG: hypothetical protein KDI06_15500, partial [Calditrichaeota bacterium]|nr:hypothetical protein [Calditrichota bacterium]
LALWEKVIVSFESPVSAFFRRRIWFNGNNNPSFGNKIRMANRVAQDSNKKVPGASMENKCVNLAVF